MKEFQQPKQSPASNYELVRLHLDIGQCRFIYAHVSKEHQRMIQSGINDTNDAVLQLLDALENCAFPNLSTPFHHDSSFDDYLESHDIDELNKLLSTVYVEGSFAHGYEV